jgi:hypothetical protein
MLRKKSGKQSHNSLKVKFPGINLTKDRKELYDEEIKEDTRR